MTKAMKRIEDRAKSLVPVDDGALRDSITTKNAKARRQRGSARFERQTGVEILTGPTGRQEGGYGAFQEFGTVNMPANPFMRPSADFEGPAVIDEVARHSAHGSDEVGREGAEESGEEGVTHA